MKTGMCSLVIALAVSLVLAVPSHAQQTTAITVGQANCGRSALPNLNCYSVPLTIGNVTGTAWIDVQNQAGFILFRPNLEGSNYVEGQITGAFVEAHNAIGQVTRATITFKILVPSANGAQADPDNNNDSDGVQGSITLNASYTFGGGRFSGWACTITGGSGAQSITQD